MMVLFAGVIHETLDIGRPKPVQLSSDRWVTKSAPGSFRTRVITDGVIPSVHLDYKATRIKQYHKEGQALRTETTINNARRLLYRKETLQSRQTPPDWLPGESAPAGSREDLP